MTESVLSFILSFENRGIFLKVSSSFEHLTEPGSQALAFRSKPFSSAKKLRSGRRLTVSILIRFEDQGLIRKSISMIESIKIACPRLAIVLLP